MNKPYSIDEAMRLSDPYTMDDDKKTQWVDLSLKSHEAIARVVWTMEDDDASPECEAVARRLTYAWNACVGVDTSDLTMGMVNQRLREYANQVDELQTIQKDLIEVVEFLLAHPDKMVPRMAAAAVLKTIKEST